MGNSSALGSGIPPCRAPTRRGDLISFLLQLPSEQEVVPRLELQKEAVLELV